MLDPSPRPSYRSSDFSPDIMILSAADLLEFNPAFYQTILTATRMARGAKRQRRPPAEGSLPNRPPP